MTIEAIIILTIGLVALALLAETVREVFRDTPAKGQQPPPRSHPEDVFATSSRWAA